MDSKLKMRKIRMVRKRKMMMKKKTRRKKMRTTMR